MLIFIMCKDFHNRRLKKIKLLFSVSISCPPCHKLVFVQSGIFDSLDERATFESIQNRAVSTMHAKHYVAILSDETVAAWAPCSNLLLCDIFEQIFQARVKHHIETYKGGNKGRTINRNRNDKRKQQFENILIFFSLLVQSDCNIRIAGHALRC